MYYFIVNPASRSNKGASVFKEVEGYLKQNHIEYKVYFSKKAGHVKELMHQITSEHLADDVAPNVIVMGGDGTLNEALQGVSDFSRVNIGYVPTGSGNDFAHSFNYPEEPVKALQKVLNCKMPRLIDLGKLKYENIINAKESIPQIRYFAVSSGVGFDAAICEAAQGSTAKKILNKLGIGKLIYGYIAVKLLYSDHLTNAILKLDNEEVYNVEKLRFVVGMNTPFEGGGFKFAPNANPEDGFLDICLVNDISSNDALRILPSAPSGKHVKDEHVHIYRVKSFEVITKDPVWIHTDGEVYAKSNHVKISVLPKKLRLLY